jgi:hypothetical protein
MKKTIKRILLTTLATLMLIGCGIVKKQQERNDYPLGTSMKITCNIENGTKYQIDSIIVADTLPQLDRWLRSVYLDYETGERYIKRMYIRSYENGTEKVYLILGSEEPYKISKRITE